MISKINPEIVKAVIASGSADAAATMENSDIFPPRAGKKQNQSLSSPLSLCNPIHRYIY